MKLKTLVTKLSEAKNILLSETYELVEHVDNGLGCYEDHKEILQRTEEYEMLRTENKFINLFKLPYINYYKYIINKGFSNYSYNCFIHKAYNKEYNINLINLVACKNEKYTIEELAYYNNDYNDEEEDYFGTSYPIKIKDNKEIQINLDRYGLPLIKFNDLNVFLDIEKYFPGIQIIEYYIDLKTKNKKFVNKLIQNE